MLAPLTDLVSECEETKATRRNRTKKNPWHWDESHQKAFDDVKKTVGCDFMLAYPDYSQLFSMYTVVSTRQLGAIVIQNNRPIAF